MPWLREIEAYLFSEQNLNMENGNKKTIFRVFIEKDKKSVGIISAFIQNDILFYAFDQRNIFREFKLENILRDKDNF